MSKVLVSSSSPSCARAGHRSTSVQYLQLNNSVLMKCALQRLCVCRPRAHFLRLASGESLAVSRTLSHLSLEKGVLNELWRNLRSELFENVHSEPRQNKEDFWQTRF